MQNEQKFPCVGCPHGWAADSKTGCWEECEEWLAWKENIAKKKKEVKDA